MFWNKKSDLMIDWKKLSHEADEKKDFWKNSVTVKYVTFDNFLKPGYCEKLADFSKIAGKRNVVMNKHKHVRSKTGEQKLDRMTELQLRFFNEVNSKEMTDYISEITGIETVYADPEFFGGGLHETGNGGYLNVHTDFNYHPTTKKNRRLNLLLYLNPEWKEEWEGHIELWDNKATKPIYRSMPLQNRVLLFETNENSFHGHPAPMKLPEGITRKSLAVYYYSDWPEGISPSEITNYQLTKMQWAELTTKIAKALYEGADGLPEITERLKMHYPTRDIKIAYDSLMSLRSAPLCSEPYWQLPDGTLLETDPAKTGQEPVKDSKLEFQH